jgi:hypothetical protein
MTDNLRSDLLTVITVLVAVAALASLALRGGYESTQLLVTSGLEHFSGHERGAAEAALNQAQSACVEHVENLLRWKMHVVDVDLGPESCPYRAELRTYADEPLKGYRNGYEPGRLRTAEGEIRVQLPQVREWAEQGPYRSRLMGFLRGNSDVLEKLAVEMYARGLSVRDIEDALRDATGDPLLSRSAVSELSETLWEDYDAFCQRDLSSFEVEYLFIDAVYEGLRPWGCSQRVLCAWGDLQGRQQGLGASGPGEPGELSELP